jgi:helicase MOV-10
MTVVELVKQLWKAFYNTRAGIVKSPLMRAIPTTAPHRILVCAPSNTAADLLLQRLAPTITSTTEMFRLNSFQRDKMLSPDLERYSQYDRERNGYVVPAKMELEKYPVIVATCIMAGKLINFGFKDYFDAIIVDEAGHAVEAEVLQT